MIVRERYREIYRSLYLDTPPFLYVDRRTAELTKYAANSFLATKIAYINKIADLALMNPLISDGAINASKHGDFEQHSAEAFDQRPQARFWHRWYKFVEHGSLTKQRMCALF